MSAGLGALLVCAIIGVIVVIYKRTGGCRWRDSLDAGGFTAVVLGVVVLLFWFLAAVPLSTINRHDCQREAAGYGLDYDWSFRNDCRIRLATGQLVPADKIRITSDGKIVGES